MTTKPTYTAEELLDMRDQRVNLLEATGTPIVPNFSMAGRMENVRGAPIHDQNYKYVVGDDTVISQMTARLGPAPPDISNLFKNATAVPEPSAPEPGLRKG